MRVAVHETIAKSDGVAFRCTLSGSASDRWLEIPAWMFERSGFPEQARVAVPVRQVRMVRLSVHQGGVQMPMRVGLAGRIGEGVAVPVMFVVMVTVLVLHRWFVEVFMLMPLNQVQPQAEAHETTRNDE